MAKETEGLKEARAQGWAQDTRPLRMIAIVLLMAGLARAQQKTPQAEMPVSAYLRQAALIYLEQIESLKDRCTDHDSCKEVALGQWDKVFKPLDDRIVISLGDAPVPGDKLFWGLLKGTKDSGELLLLDKMLWFGAIEDHSPGDEAEGYQKVKDWLLIFTKCYADARSTALSGHTQADADDCGAKVDDQAKKHNAAAEGKKVQKNKQDH
jgi:hypothetical protein